MKAKEELIEMGIDFSVENNNELPPSANMEFETKQTQFVTYTTFGGCDCSVTIDGKVNGEVQSISIDSIKKELEIGISYFGQKRLDSFEDITAKEINKYNKIHNVTVSENYANEYGHAIHREITGVTYIGERSTKNIDNVTISATFVFSFEELTDFKQGVSESLKNS